MSQAASLFELTEQYVKLLVSKFMMQLVKEKL